MEGSDGNQEPEAYIDTIFIGAKKSSQPTVATISNYTIQHRTDDSNSTQEVKRISSRNLTTKG